MPFHQAKLQWLKFLLKFAADNLLKLIWNDWHSEVPLIYKAECFWAGKIIQGKERIMFFSEIVNHQICLKGFYQCMVRANVNICEKNNFSMCLWKN